jgi:hypothetical protein
MSFLDFHFSRKKYLFFPSHSRKTFYFLFSKGGILQNTDGRHSLTLILIFFLSATSTAANIKRLFAKTSIDTTIFYPQDFCKKITYLEAVLSSE